MTATIMVSMVMMILKSEPKLDERGHDDKKLIWFRYVMKSLKTHLFPT